MRKHMTVSNTKKANTTNKRRRGNLPKAVTAILRDWLSRHKKHPYPTEEEKAALATETNLNLNQISNWFINARRRILQPMLEQEEEEKNELDIIMPYENRHLGMYRTCHILKWTIEILKKNTHFNLRWCVWSTFAKKICLWSIGTYKIPTTEKINSSSQIKNAFLRSLS